MKKRQVTLLLTAAAMLASTANWLGAEIQSAPTAETLVAAAMKQAQAEHKKVFVDFGASWCKPCLKLHAFLDEPVNKAILDKYFVHVSLTVFETGTKAATNTPGAQELLTTWTQSLGVPFVAVLAPDGSRLVKAEGYGGSERIVSDLRKAASEMTDTESATLAAYFGPAPVVEEVARPTGRQVIWEPGFAFERSSVSVDGRYIAYEKQGRIFVHDLVAGADRLIDLSPAGAGGTAKAWSVAAPVISKDGRWIAYTWREDRRPAPPVPHSQLHVAPLDPATTHAPRVLAAGDDIVWLTPGDWSYDGRQIAVTYAGEDNVAHVALVSAVDGSRKVLASFPADRLPRSGWADSDDYTVAFSPDGSSLALDIRETNGHGRDVLLLSTDTGGQIPVAVGPGDEALVGWAPHGGAVMFTSDRAGSMDLWAAPLSHGEIGLPELVEDNVGLLVPVGHGADGSVLYQKLLGLGLQTLNTVSFDFARGQVSSRPAVAANDVLTGGTKMAWSPDGRQLAYLRAPGPGTGPTIGVLALDTGRVRILTPGLQALDFMPITWLTGQHAIAVQGDDFHGRWGTYRIDTTTGDASFITNGGDLSASIVGTLFFALDTDGTDNVFAQYDVGASRQTEILRGLGISQPHVSPDGRTLYFVRPAATADEADEVIGRDLSSGRERVLFRARGLDRLSGLSPDGSFLVAIGQPDGGKRYDIVLSTNGDPPKTMPYLGQLQNGSRVEWAPDSRSYLTVARTPDVTAQRWWVPVDGRDPKVVDLPGGSLSVSPADGLIAFLVSTVRRPRSEIWRLDLQFPTRSAPQPEQQAGTPTAPPDHVGWAITAFPKTAMKPGEAFSVGLTAKIDSAWHIYAMSQPEGGPIAMSIALPDGQPFELSGKPTEPEPKRLRDPAFGMETRTHEGAPVFTVPVRAAARAQAGPQQLKLSVEFQVCSDTLCMPPKTVVLEGTVTIGSGEGTKVVVRGS